MNHALGSWLIPALLSAACLGGCKKPCHGIPPSNDVKRLGIVLAGGRVCKDERSVADIDYPSATASALPGKYKSALDKAGWNSSTASHGNILFATRAGDTLFIVTGKKSKERRVPFAIVRYCTRDSCRQSLDALFKAMKKQAP